MTPAEAQNLRTMRHKYVRITFRAPDCDWPYYRLLAIREKDSTIKLRGMDYPDGIAKHEGDEFWADWGDVAKIKLVMVEKI